MRKYNLLISLLCSLTLIFYCNRKSKFQKKNNKVKELRYKILTTGKQNKYNCEILDFESFINNKLVVVFCYKLGCGPCKRFKPTFEKLAAKFPERDVLFGKINLKENMDLSNIYKIEKVPAICFFKYGNKLDKFEDKPHEREMQNMINKISSYIK